MGFFSSLFKKESATKSTASNMCSLNPNKIEDICFALCWLVGNVGESWVHVVLQDKNEKKWDEVMEISVQIDGWVIENKKISSLNTISAYQKLGLPYETAEFLSAIPFKEGYGQLSYVFEKGLDAPSSHKQDVLTSMREGVACGIKIRSNTRQATIEDRGYLVCKVD